MKENLYCQVWSCINNWLRSGLKHGRSVYGGFLKKLKRRKKNVIRYSMEPIYHFRCAVCRMWWSIGDWEITKDMYCPHCGSRGRTIPVGKEKC